MNQILLSANPQITSDLIERFGIAGGFGMLLYWVLNRHTKEMERIHEALLSLTSTIEQYLRARES